MSKIEVDQVDPQSGTTLTLGTSGDTVSIPSGVTLANAGTVTGIPASAISSGTLADARIPDLNASKITAGTIATARLGSGTASSSTFLRGDQTYAAVSSDFVLLSSTTPSAANTFSIDGHFTSDYDIYKIYAIGMSGSGMSNTRLSFRVNVGGTAQTGGSYYFQTVNSSKTTLAVWADNTGGTSADLGYVHSSSGSTKQGNLEMTIFRPLGTDVTGMLHEMLAWDNGTDGGKYMGSTFYNVATAISGITLGVGAFGSGNIEADRILVYGMKNS